MVPRKPTAKSVSYRLTAEARRLLAELAKRQGVSMTALLELLIRQEAEREGKTFDEARAEAIAQAAFGEHLIYP